MANEHADQSPPLIPDPTFPADDTLVDGARAGGAPAASYDDAELERLQTRTLRVLFASAIFGRAAMSIGFAVAVLLIKEMLGDGTWAGSSTAAITIGTAISASALSRYMNRNGRRPGLALGYVAATVGSIVALLGGQTLLLAPFLLGLLLVGVGQGGTNLARYAAADLAKPEVRGKAISSVVFASTIGAVGGPALLGSADSVGESIGLDEFVGAYLYAGVFFFLAGAILVIGLRPDPLVVAGGLRTGPAPGTRGGSSGGLSEGFSAIMANPVARVAAIGLALSQAVMVMVMAMTPLHMDAHGHGVAAVGWIISVHTAGMYAFAPIAGWASDRYGRMPTLALGGLVLIAATVMTALAGDAPVSLMFPGLFLLGLGWSFGIVAASALLTESVEAESVVAAQGSADFITAFASGSGALASGFVFTMAGFHILSMIGIAGAGVVLVSAYYRHRMTPPVALS